jgi:hypothetical protein
MQTNPVITTLVMMHVDYDDASMSVACSLCSGIWAANRTKILADFHNDGCPLKGASEEHIEAQIVDREFAYDMFCREHMNHG